MKNLPTELPEIAGKIEQIGAQDAQLSLSHNQRLESDEARFRRKFALHLFYLFAGVLMLTFLAIFGAAMLEARLTQSQAAIKIIEALDKFYPIALSAVTGVFGTAVGFFFGANTPGNHIQDE